MSFLKTYYMQIALVLLTLFSLGNLYVTLMLWNGVAQGNKIILEILNKHDSAIVEIIRVLQGSPM